MKSLQFLLLTVACTFTMSCTKRIDIASPAAPVSGNLIVDMKVANLTSGSSALESVEARPGDHVRFIIRCEATGSAQLKNLTLRDIIPTRLTFLPTLMINGVVQDEGEFLSTGLNLGSVYASQPIVITYTASILMRSAFQKGVTVLTSTVTARTDQTATVADSADVRVVVEP